MFLLFVDINVGGFFVHTLISVSRIMVLFFYHTIILITFFQCALYDITTLIISVLACSCTVYTAIACKSWNKHITYCTVLNFLPMEVFQDSNNQGRQNFSFLCKKISLRYIFDADSKITLSLLQITLKSSWSQKASNNCFFMLP